MKTSCFPNRAVLLLLPACIAAAPLAAQTMTLTGSVRTTGGDPLAARISILKGPPAAGIETHDTAADGTFSIATSSAGLQVVSALADGYASREVRRSGSAAFPSLHFRLPAVRRIQGRVRDGSGNALSGVNVQVRYLDAPRRLILDDDWRAETDADGAFTLAAAVSGGGRFVVDALPEDRVPASSPILGAGSVSHTGAVGDDAHSNILISLQALGSRVTGRVTSTSGKALANVLVRAVVKTPTPRVNEGIGPGAVPTPGGAVRPFNNELRKYAETDGGGRYSMAGLPAGSLAVVAGKAGAQAQVQRFASVEGGAFTADFVFPD